MASSSWIDDVGPGITEECHFLWLAMWHWGLTSGQRAYLVSTLLSISSPLFRIQTDTQAGRQTETDRQMTERKTERQRDLHSALCGPVCLLLSAAHTRLVGHELPGIYPPVLISDHA